MKDERSIISDINVVRQLSEIYIKANPSPITDLNVDVNAVINTTTATLLAINSIKAELCRLPLNFCETEYINNCITPLVILLELMSLISFEMSLVVPILTFSPIVPVKKSKQKKTIDLIYDINEECEELYKVLKKRLEQLM